MPRWTKTRGNKSIASAINNGNGIIQENREFKATELPTNLKKLLYHTLTHETPLTLIETCKVLKIRYTSVKTQMYELRKRGIDFQKYVDDIAEQYLRQNLLVVDKAMLTEAVSGSFNHQKLYYQRIGKLSEVSAPANITLSIGLNISNVEPQDHREAGTIDVEPIIPTLPASHPKE